MRFQSLRYDEPGLQEDHQEEGLGFPQAMMTSLIYNKINIVSVINFLNSLSFFICSPLRIRLAPYRLNAPNIRLPPKYLSRFRPPTKQSTEPRPYCTFVQKKVSVA